MCNWVHLPSKYDPIERRCSAEGTPYCMEHDAELRWYTWKELEAHENQNGCVSRKRSGAKRNG
jgi:hypothetical protein